MKTIEPDGEGLGALSFDRPLTRAERDILRRVMRALSNKAIALELGCAIKTVEFHMRNILAKAKVRSRVELLARAASVAPPDG